MISLKILFPCLMFSLSCSAVISTEKHESVDEGGKISTHPVIVAEKEGNSVGQQGEQEKKQSWRVPVVSAKCQLALSAYKTKKEQMPKESSPLKIAVFTQPPK